MTATMPSIRPACHEDVEAAVAFEVEIARISFPGRAVVDREFHRRRVLAALGRDSDGTFVAACDGGGVVGWAWITLRSNAATGERYGELRSLAVAPELRGARIAGDLLAVAAGFAEDRGVHELVGRTHVANHAMRAALSRAGFTDEHVTMARRPATPAR